MHLLQIETRRREWRRRRQLPTATRRPRRHPGMLVPCPVQVQDQVQVQRRRTDEAGGSGGVGASMPVSIVEAIHPSPGTPAAGVIARRPSSCRSAAACTAIPRPLRSHLLVAVAVPCGIFDADRIRQRRRRRPWYHLRRLLDERTGQATHRMSTSVAGGPGPWTARASVGDLTAPTEPTDTDHPRRRRRRMTGRDPTKARAPCGNRLNGSAFARREAGGGHRVADSIRGQGTWTTRVVGMPGHQSCCLCRRLDRTVWMVSEVEDRCP